MILFGRRFEPAPWSILLTAAGMVLFLALGNWQLQRAAYKQALQDKFESRLAGDYEIFRPGGEHGDLQYRKLVLRGSYQRGHHFLLDNQLHQGRAGYHVLTPFRLADSDDLILVNRGWAAWGAARDPLPQILPPETQKRAVGIISIPGEPPLKLGEYGSAGGWPRLIPYIDFEILRAQYSEHLLPYVLWLAPEQPGAYLREWKPVWLPPEKSRAYATQWFAFAAIALLLFISLNLRKTE